MLFTPFCRSTKSTLLASKLANYSAAASLSSLCTGGKPAGKYTDSRGTDIDKEGWCTGTASDDFQQEAVVQTGFADSETHGGTDVFLGAIGVGSDNFHGSLENIEVFNLVRKAIGLDK